MINDVRQKLEAASSPLQQEITDQYITVRNFSEKLCEPLVAEDYVIQSMPDVSPTKWHLAHVSWFWETFVLSAVWPEYKSLHPQYTYLFNSYYNSVGARHCRAKRGMISRPTVNETYQYRRYVDEHMLTLLAKIDEEQFYRLLPVLRLGLNHEQQHQELMLTDIKHVLSWNPLHPIYRERTDRAVVHDEQPMQWITYPEGLYWIGHTGNGFAFDNESPRHQQFLQPFQIASRLITNKEYQAFMEDGGYQNPLLWLSEGWATVCRENWQAPLYWEKCDNQWHSMTLSGFRPIDPTEPVCHVSYFEADAYARWAGARLPREIEWEVAAQDIPLQGNFAENASYHPQPLTETPSNGKPAQMYGDVWEWTQSHYSPYPGYHPSAGAIGEYNGKFMCNQFVLRGGSCATPVSHMRKTYRNFFPAHSQWQFMGIRLAQEV